MKITAISDFDEPDKTQSFPLGSVDKDFIRIGSITLDREGDGGQISLAQALLIITEAVQTGAKIEIKYEEVAIVVGDE